MTNIGEVGGEFCGPYSRTPTLKLVLPEVVIKQWLSEMTREMMLLENLDKEEGILEASPCVRLISRDNEPFLF